MSSPVSPSQPDALVPRRGAWYDPGLRVGDAERGAVTDRLSRHFADGRLDQQEFSDRLDRAMTARTMADLASLLADMPDGPVTPVPLTGSRRHQRKLLRLQLEHQRLQVRQQLREQRLAERRDRVHTLRWLPLFVLAMITAIVVIHTLTHSVVAWILLAVIAFLWVRHTASGRRRGD